MADPNAIRTEGYYWVREAGGAAQIAEWARTDSGEWRWALTGCSIGIPDQRMTPISGLLSAPEESGQSMVHSFPLTIRGAFTVGPSEVVWTQDEVTAAVLRGIDASPVSEVLVTRGTSSIVRSAESVEL